MAAFSLFAEDEVCVQKPGKGFCFGLILENSEFLSSSDDEDGEKPEDRLQAGTVKVAWHPNGRETVVPENKLQLVDRSLMPGDVVRRLIPGQESQCGFVIDMDVRSHLRILRTNKYIYNVDSKDLQPIEQFESGQEVMLDSWLGRIENVITDAVLVFSDGAKCQIDQNDLYSFEEKAERHGKFNEYLYYPGQELKGPLASIAEAKWLHSTARHSHKAATKKGRTPTVHVTIEKVVTKQVDVLWVFRGYKKVEAADITVSPPSRVVEGSDLDRLKVLDWFSHCSIQIGDRMFYQVKNDDSLSTVPPSKAYNAVAACTKDCPVKAESETDNRNSTNPSASNSNQSVKNDSGEADNNDDAAFIDIFEEEEDDSDFEQDERLGACGGRNTGSRSSGGGGGNKKKHSMYKVGGGGVCAAHRHKHGRHPKPAVRKAACPKERSVKADDVVEVEVEFNTSFAMIMWQDGTVEKDIPSVELFPVHHLDELEFFPGDYVLPNVALPEQIDYGVLVKADHRERTCLIHWFKAYDVGKASEPIVVERNAEMSVYDIRDHPDYKFRPGQSVVRVGGFENLPADSDASSQAVGQIFELDPNGHLVIKWADGSISQCFPQEIFIVSDEADESDNESWDSGSDYDSEASGDTWETESESEVIGEDAAKGDTGNFDSQHRDEDAPVCEHKQELNTLLTRAETALSRLQKLLNSFDVTVSAPDCFTDILRIYRSCHDLDKILQSSFFNDSELQTLISQAKLELSRDRVNRISRNLTQVFEQWSKSLPAGAAGAMAREISNVGTVSVGGKTIKIGTVKNGMITEVNIQVPVEGKENDNSCKAESKLPPDSGNIAVGDSASILEGGDQRTVLTTGDMAKSLSPDLNSLSCSECSEASRGMKKESSEPSISQLCGSGGERRPSDPLSDYSAALAHRGNESNLVGENCVSKAAKRAKSDGYDDSGREAKKSRDEGRTASSNHVAQELCFKICQNLQRQVVKIQEEVNKRAHRLISASGEGNKSLSEKSSQTASLAKDGAELSRNDSLLSSATEDKTSGEHASIVGNGLQHTAKSRGLTSLTDNSVPHSMDEAGERITATPAMSTPRGELGHNGEAQTCDEAGDVLRLGATAAARTDPGNEASCEESSSQVSLASEDVQADLVPCKGFEIYGEVISSHKYISQDSQPTNPRTFRNSIRKELKLFQSSLPDGIFVKGFEDRLDLFSIMILGPEGTPYEDALFLFDMMLPSDYPTSPPVLHYYSFCRDRLNPNLYEDGKVCVSLLGTWSGKGSEVWTSKSNLLQVLLSIQGLILVSEPYYNEANYERQRCTQVGLENSRMYNEMAILKTVHSLTCMCRSLPELFKHEIYQFLKSHGPRMIARLRHWMDLSEQQRKAAGAKGATLATQDLTESETTTWQQQSGSRSPSLVEGGTLGEEEQPSTGEETDAGQSICMQGESSSSSYTTTHHIGAGEGTTTSAAVERDVESEASRDQPLVHSSSVDGGYEKAGHTSDSFYAEAKQTKQGGSDESDGVGSCSSQQDADKLPPPVARASSPNAILAVADVGRDEDMGTSVDTVPSQSPASPKESFLPQSVSPNLSSKNGSCLKEPDFPLFPVSRGFCLTLQKCLTLYEQALCSMQDPAIAKETEDLDPLQEKETLDCDSAPPQEGSEID